MTRVVCLSIFSLVAIACSGRDDGFVPPDGSPVGGEGLRVEPADLVAAIAGAPVVVDYRALLRESSGMERDVTADVVWESTVPELGAFSGAQFISTVDRGGRTTIRATLGALVATTSLTLTRDTIIVTPTAPDDAPTMFGGVVDPAAAPDLVYPEDGTMVPPNLEELEFHYRTSGSTVFELSFDTTVGSIRIYFGCPEMAGGGCIYTPDRDVWQVLSNAMHGAGPITYRLRGVDAGGRLGETSQRTLVVADENITGGIYYWNAARGAIMRFEFGVRGAREERYLDTGATGALMCVGCHALSRDGRRIGVGTDVPTSTFQVFDVATRTRVYQRGTGISFPPMPTEPNFSSFSPDGIQIVQSLAAGLRIVDGNTGTPMIENLGGGPSTMPDWSPDGNHIVYVRHDQPGGGPFGLVDFTGIVNGRIVRLDRSGTEWVVGPTLAESVGENLYYPSYSPDGGWIVYNRSPSNTNSLGNDPKSGMSGVEDSELWFVSAEGGAIRALENIAGLQDSWPKFDPTEYLDRGRPIYWMAWSTRRAFGLRLPERGEMQLWMCAFDPMRAAAGELPTYPAFRLPFQNIESGNHIPQWVTTIERKTCVDDGDCGGEFCIEGRCYEQPPLI